MTHSEEDEASYGIREIPVAFSAGQEDGSSEQSSSQKSSTIENIPGKSQSSRKSASSHAGVAVSLGDALQYMKDKTAASSKPSGDESVSVRSHAQTYKDFREAYNRGDSFTSFRQVYRSDATGNGSGGSAWTGMSSAGSVRTGTSSGGSVRTNGASSSGGSVQSGTMSRSNSSPGFSELQSHFGAGNDSAAKKADKSALGTSDAPSFNGSNSVVSSASGGQVAANAAGSVVSNSSRGGAASSVVSNSSGRGSGPDGCPPTLSRHSTMARRESGSVMSRRSSGDTTKSTLSRSEALNMSMKTRLCETTRNCTQKKRHGGGGFQQLAMAVLTTDKDNSQTSENSQNIEEKNIV